MSAKSEIDTSLDILGSTESSSDCPKCGSKMVKRTKNRLNTYTHSKCLECGFGYIKG